MKILLVIMVMISVVGIAGAGVLAMNHGLGHGHGGCIAARARGLDCPQGAGVLSFLKFHIDSFKSFSTAVWGSAIFAYLLLRTVFKPMAGLSAGMGAGTDQNQSTSYFWHTLFLDTFFPPSKIGFNRWLAIHENSPAV